MSDSLPINAQSFSPQTSDALSSLMGAGALGSANPAGFAKGLFNAAQVGQQWGADFSSHLGSLAGASAVSSAGLQEGVGAGPRGSVRPLAGASRGQNLIKQMLDAADGERRAAEEVNRSVFLGKASVQEAVIAQEKYQVYLELILHTRKKLEEGVKQIMNYGV